MLPPPQLINGYAATGADWDPGLLDALGRPHRVIRPDNRGMGDAGLGEEELTIDLMAADLVRLLDAEGIERVPVVGWSMGGFVAQRPARQAPARASAAASARRRRSGRPADRVGDGKPAVAADSERRVVAGHPLGTAAVAARFAGAGGVGGASPCGRRQPRRQLSRAARQNCRFASARRSRRRSRRRRTSGW